MDIISISMHIIAVAVCFYIGYKTGQIKDTERGQNPMILNAMTFSMKTKKFLFQYLVKKQLITKTGPFYNYYRTLFVDYLIILI